LGINSYLSYWRDRLIVARELLTESGSVFVQIGDENVHLVRCVLDEVFGSENFLVSIVVKKKSVTTVSDPINDYLLWYGRDAEQTKKRIRRLTLPKSPFDEDARFKYVEFPDGSRKLVSECKQADLKTDGVRFLNDDYPLVSQEESEERSRPFTFNGRQLFPGKGRHWTYDPTVGLGRLALAGRIRATENTARGVVYFDDFGREPIPNIWEFHGEPGPIYVVQTNRGIVERCVLMTTDPGDLVLDPTCFRAGTRVKTESGWKAIETVRRGERVWTHRGRLRRVVGVQARPHVGPMVGLRARGVEATVWMTPEHRLLTALSTPPPAPSPFDGEGNGQRTPQVGQTTPPLAPPHRMGRGTGRGQAKGWGAVHAALGGKPGRAKVQFARTLREEATDAEGLLWQELRGRRVRGSKFRRQHPLGPHYIADFYCAEARLAVELDGSIHAVDRKRWGDGLRHGQMQMLAGVRVLRFENQRVIGDMEGVLREIAEHLASPLHPSPSDGEGPGVGAGVGTLPRPQQIVWREARSLQPGDRVVGDECGAVLQIETVLHEHGTETVYDLTVEEDHSFVTEIGVAHNCGSGTTAFVAEQWGRRWITIDTSRVAIALARTRLMAAKFPYYLLADSPEGVRKEAELTGRMPPEALTPTLSQRAREIGDIKRGFVYKRVPHVTLKSIANNPDILKRA
jgi:very-short-patch-repair endonuclease